MIFHSPSKAYRKSLEDLQSNYDKVVYHRDKLQQDYEEIVVLREKEMSSSEHDEQQVKEAQQTLQQHQTQQQAAAIDNMQLEFDKVKMDYDILFRENKLLQENLLKVEEQKEKLNFQCASALQGFQKALSDRQKTNKDFLAMKQSFEMMQGIMTFQF